MGWHIVVTEEMRALGLSGNDLMVFALIYGFSQGGQGCFYGSMNYICEACGISRKTAHNILKSLVENEFLIKEESIRNNVRYVSYKVKEGCVKITQGVQNLHGGCVKITPNNKIDNNSSIQKNINNKGIRYDFETALIEIGVSPQVAKDWMQVRKAKRAANTETAFKRIKEEIDKSGLPANDCITIAVERSWQGFQAEWLNNYQRGTPARKVSVLDNNRAVAEELMRMSMKLEEM